MLSSALLKIQKEQRYWCTKHYVQWRKYLYNTQTNLRSEASATLGARKSSLSLWSWFQPTFWTTHILHSSRKNMAPVTQSKWSNRVYCENKTRRHNDRIGDVERERRNCLGSWTQPDEKGKKTSLFWSACSFEVDSVCDLLDFRRNGKWNGHGNIHIVGTENCPLNVRKSWGQWCHFQFLFSKHVLSI